MARKIEIAIPMEELVCQNEEKEKLLAELNLVNKELAFQNREKEKLAAELIIANEELKNAKEFQSKHIRDLEEMMFITSHKVRPPIAHILGLSILLTGSCYTQEDLKKIIEYDREISSIVG